MIMNLIFTLVMDIVDYFGVKSLEIFLTLQLIFAKTSSF